MPGDIIARQRGFKWKTGNNVIIGHDQTIHAKVEGIVTFRDGL
jgi:large subunit ribosomal protein L27